MTAQLSLAIWLPEALRSWRVRYFEKLLALFPFSRREQPQSTLYVHAVSLAEPALLELQLDGPADLERIAAVMRDYTDDDVAFRLESWWDLWHFTGDDWRLGPVRAILSCFGPQFDNGTSLAPGRQESFRIEFGVDALFLPQPDLPGSARLTESNIRSLLRLVHEVEDAIPLEMRALETESGENFADKLAHAMGGIAAEQ